MAFGNINTFYFPTNANAGASQWGTDVRKLLSAVDATADATNKTDHSTGGAVIRTIDPNTTSTTDGVEANFGWAIAPADMGSVVGAKRFFPAGDHIATVRMGHNGTTAVTGTMTMYIYRVGVSPTRTRTLLGSGTATIDFPITSGEVTMTLTKTMSEIVFEADETVQYSFELSLAGIAILGRTATFFTGTQASVAARLNTPTLKVLADTIGTATGLGEGLGVTGKVLGTNGTAIGLGEGNGIASSTWSSTGTATGLGLATGLGSSVAGTVGSANGSCLVNGQASKVLGTIGTVEIGAVGGGVVTVIRKIFGVFD